MHPAPESLTRRLARRLRTMALPCAAATVAACAANPGPGGPLPAFAEFEGDEVTSVRFEAADLRVSRDSIEAVVSTKPTRCTIFLGLCPFGWKRVRGDLDLGVLSRDVVRIQLVYRDAGYYGTRVTPRVEPAGDDQVRVSFQITPGDQVILRDLTLEGVEGVVTDTARLRRRLPLQAGEPFSRRDFVASADTVRSALLREGYVYGQVLRNYAIDTIADVAEARFVAAPGPLVRVDSILIAGTYRLEQKIVRRQLTFNEGDVLRNADLSQSQRNLFEVELVDFASVEIAPDSLQLSVDSLELQPDSIGTTVLVRVVEAARYQMETALGYGTQDCLRGEVTRVDRNFLGGARRLELSGAVSKVGVGGLGGLEDTFVCGALNPDELKLPTAAPRRDTLLARATATELNYRAAFNFLQPRFFGTRTSVLAGGRAERVSEVGLYVRESVGGELGAVRRVAPRTVLTGSFNAERGSTRAQDVFFCRAFEVCEREGIEQLRRPRWTNFLSLGLVHNRVRGAAQPVGGYQLRGGMDFASPLLASDDQYLRGLAEGVIHRELRPGWTLSGRLLAGSFLGGFSDGDDFIPPERRFYAGGPNSVRGYSRNQLGPQVYVAAEDTTTGLADRDEVQASATGGTRTVVASAELTVPSPWYPDRFRLASFVDAGQVWDTNDCGPENVRCNLGLRITPGVGLRFLTPVGPIRVDAAFNPYLAEPGPLYRIDRETGDLVLEERVFQPERGGGILDRLTFHIAVGTAF